MAQLFTRRSFLGAALAPQVMAARPSPHTLELDLDSAGVVGRAPVQHGCTAELLAWRPVKFLRHLKWPGGCASSAFRWNEAADTARVNVHPSSDSGEWNTLRFLDLATGLNATPHFAANTSTASAVELYQWKLFVRQHRPPGQVVWQLAAGDWPCQGEPEPERAAARLRPYLAAVQGERVAVFSPGHDRQWSRHFLIALGSGSAVIRRWGIKPLSGEELGARLRSERALLDELGLSRVPLTVEEWTSAGGSGVNNMIGMLAALSRTCADAATFAASPVAVEGPAITGLIPLELTSEHRGVRLSAPDDQLIIASRTARTVYLTVGARHTAVDIAARGTQPLKVVKAGVLVSGQSGMHRLPVRYRGRAVYFHVPQDCIASVVLRHI